MSKRDKKIGIEQNRLVHLESQLGDQKAKLAELKYAMEVAYFILQGYKTLLDKMQKNLGYLFMDYEQDGDIYTFQDGSTFNYATQDFTFHKTGRQESFRIYHIAFGKTVFAKSIDDSFVHMHLSSVDPEDKYTYEKVVAKTGSTMAMSISDSIQTMEIFRKILDKDLPIELNVYAGGIMGKDGDSYFRDSLMTAEPYNKDNEENNEAWKYRADWDTKIHLSVEVWQDKMLPFNFESMQKGYDKLKKKYPSMTEIDYTSGVKAKLIAHNWVEQMKNLVPLWFEDLEDRAKLNRKLNGLLPSKVGFLNHNVFAKVPLMLPE